MPTQSQAYGHISNELPTIGGFPLNAVQKYSHRQKYAGVNPESQKAYELASVGIVRPQSKETPPLLYGIKCIDFNLPDFTLEIHSINENSDFLKALIHDIGIKLKSTAVCSSIRRIRYGYFTLDHCLLRADWHFEQILSNIRLCKQLLTDKKLITAQNVKPSKLLSGNDVKLLDKKNKVVSDSDSKFLAGSYSQLFTDDNLVSDKNGELISDNGAKLTGDNDGESIYNDEMMDDNKYCRENESDIFNPDYERIDGVDKTSNSNEEKELRDNINGSQLARHLRYFVKKHIKKKFGAFDYYVDFITSCIKSKHMFNV
ncbi:hypothetical protein KUTeg_015091 [Tegillarca granosa]|uniref:tRNA pseudouridine synthase 2 n=1 Tax=Tegillarca granosa TaxID=220873 RepID=A0ABQ9ESR9_TEGGR|nr:hypothetical protein KUTeg_015091 [Tegillarca granosa]